MDPVCRSIVLLAAFAAGGSWAVGQEEPPLRREEPLAAVVADLERFIPARMREDEVPGLSVALVREWNVVWAEGFGVANIVTRSPVEPDSVFAIASNSKVITAYLALQLVDDGVLALDDPVTTLVPEPWALSGYGGDRISARHLASHSSGLGDQLFPLDTTVRFEPGSRFQYSGVGFLYLQDVMEQASGQPLEQLGRERLFEPLGMTATDYVGSSSIRRMTANGHMGLRYALLVALVPSSALFLALLCIASLVHRLSRGSWGVGWNRALPVLAIALGVTAVGLARVPGRALPNVVLLAVVCCAVFYLLIAGSAALVFRRVERPVLRAAWVGASFVLLWWMTGPIMVPLPRVFKPRASAVGSARSSAVDMATFLIELGRPQRLSPALAAELRTPQTRINERFSWGVGPAIQHSAQGDALWQMGITPGFRSVMLVYPDHGEGVVVMANSSNGLPLVYDVAARALGGRDDFAGF